MSEIYRTISGYDGLYEVSNYGNVKSLWFGKERILKPSADIKGYMYVSLWKNDKAKKYKVHRLVASAFIENPDNLPQVNHKDEDKTNNFVFVNEDGTVDYDKSNLEWCTNEYNHNYGSRNERAGETNINGKCSIPIDMLTKNSELIRTFPSAMEAERWLRINGYPKASNTHIIQCCKGNRNIAYGFKWRYAQGN